MKGKLIKQDGIGIQTIDGIDYYLILDGKVYHTNPVTLALCNGGKLSKKNCEAVANGYDLDELADEFAKTKSSHSTFQNTHKRDFREGFQKALEIIGDKKFNQNDVLDVVNHVLNKMVLFEGFDKQYLFPESVYHEVTTKCQSIQQNEWDVEIVMEEMPYSSELSEEEIKNLEVFVPQNFTRPKLDSEGCLALKRI